MNQTRHELFILTALGSWVLSPLALQPEYESWTQDIFPWRDIKSLLKASPTHQPLMCQANNEWVVRCHSWHMSQAS